MGSGEGRGGEADKHNWPTARHVYMYMVPKKLESEVNMGMRLSGVNMGMRLSGVRMGTRLHVSTTDLVFLMVEAEKLKMSSSSSPSSNRPPIVVVLGFGCVFGGCKGVCGCTCIHV